MPLYIEDQLISCDGHDIEFLLPSKLYNKFQRLKYDSAKFVELVKNGPKHKHLSMADRVLYVGQCEFATIAPNKDRNGIRYIGSDDATTCHIVCLQHLSSGCIGVAHMDGTGTLDCLKRMAADLLNYEKLSSGGSPSHSSVQEGMVHDDREGELLLSIFGGFVDEKKYSEKLLTEILSASAKLSVNIHLNLACCYELNSMIKNNRVFPVIYGIAVDVKTGEIFAASHNYKGPDDLLRHARLIGGGASCVTGIYDMELQSLRIQPFSYRKMRYAQQLLRLPDDMYLQCSSTSPHCEPVNFVQDSKRAVQFILDHPDSKLFFGNGPRVYNMDSEGEWVLQ